MAMKVGNFVSLCFFLPWLAFAQESLRLVDDPASVETAPAWVESDDTARLLFVEPETSMVRLFFKGRN